MGCAKLVSQLQHLTQLTHLTLKGTLQITASSAPTAACAALTASSKLQHLDFRECTMPADVWEQVSVECWRPSVFNSVCNDSSFSLLSHLVISVDGGHELFELLSYRGNIYVFPLLLLTCQCT